MLSLFTRCCLPEGGLFRCSLVVEELSCCSCGGTRAAARRWIRTCGTTKPATAPLHCWPASTASSSEAEEAIIFQNQYRIELSCCCRYCCGTLLGSWYYYDDDVGFHGLNGLGGRGCAVCCSEAIASSKQLEDEDESDHLSLCLKGPTADTGFLPRSWRTIFQPP
jgi:hypothetical protein